MTNELCYFAPDESSKNLLKKKRFFELDIYTQVWSFSLALNKPSLGTGDPFAKWGLSSVCTEMFEKI